MRMLKKYENLVAQLSSATMNNNLPWLKTSRPNEYEAAIGDNSVSLKYHPKGSGDQDSEEYVSLILWDKFGDKADELRLAGSSSDFISLYSLYERVRASNNRSEMTLDEILTDISKIN